LRIFFAERQFSLLQIADKEILFPKEIHHHMPVPPELSILEDLKSYAQQAVLVRRSAVGTEAGRNLADALGEHIGHFNPKTAIGFGRISQRLRAVAHWTLPRRTLWCVEREGQCANAEGFAKGVPNAIAVFGFKGSAAADTAPSGARKFPRFLRVPNLIFLLEIA
jgi:hypothetical protein